MVEDFQDNDAGFVAWVAVNPAGYVLNIQRSHNPVDARVHAAGCGHIARAIRAAEDGTKRATSTYIKVCSVSLTELDEWSQGEIGRSIRRCPHCLIKEMGDVRSPSDTRHAEPRRARPASSAYDVHDVEGEIRLEGPRCIRFEESDVDALRARSQLRGLLRTLKPGPGAILHARYGGHRPANADVENLLIYNIDMGGAAFKTSAGYGVRFEESAQNHSNVGTNRRGCHYSYRLISADAPLGDWIVRDTLARFTRVELGAFGSDYRLAQTWFAVKNTTIDRPAAAAQAPFGVFLELDAPAGAAAGVAPGLLKSLIDGVVCAFQNHLNYETVGDVAARIALAIGEKPAEVAAKLLSDERAVLGSQHQLVYLRGNGVQWNPADHLCVAGQVLRRVGDRWRLSGRVCTLEPRVGVSN